MFWFGIDCRSACARLHREETAPNKAAAVSPAAIMPRLRPRARSAVGSTVGLRVRGRDRRSPASVLTSGRAGLPAGSGRPLRTEGAARLRAQRLAFLPTSGHRGGARGGGGGRGGRG